MHKETLFGRLAICIVIAALFWLLPVPEGIDPNATHLLGIFVATILAIVLKVMPTGAVALLGLTATILTRTLTFEAAFATFNNNVVWLVVAAFFIARGFTKTGLGSRIAYLFVRMLGKKTLGLSYGLLVTEVILSPAIPSSTARAGGVVFPILDNLSRSFGSAPDEGTARRMGSFLTMVAAQATAITGAMFMTAMAPNPLIVQFAGEQGIQFTWASWAIAASAPCILALALVPLVIYKLYPPAVKNTPHAAEFANQKLAEMGKMKTSEKTMLGTFVVLVALWIFGDTFGISSTTTALLGLCFLLAVGVLSWKDILGEQGAWDTLFWFAALVSMASNLSSFGVVQWAGVHVSGVVGALSWPVALLLVAILYFYLHYFFASQLAHVVSMYAVFLTILLSVGAPPMPTALLLGFFSSLFGALTHYASGPSAIFYGSKYVPITTWWKLSLVVSVINIAIFIFVGGAWWKVLGLW
ncbi:MAG: DASS family sodium-coupled anion symporter [Verrucomicrobia bacterium]|nr:DASS family sodium-coupled anion symporter [Verrucomicrobiota bacterium]